MTGGAADSGSGRRAAAPLVGWGDAGYTEWQGPLPSVAAMVVLAVAPFAGWCVASYLGA